MQSRRSIRNDGTATRPRRISLDLTDDAVDLKLMEAIQRIERVRSKALLAVGSMIAAQR